MSDARRVVYRVCALLAADEAERFICLPREGKVRPRVYELFAFPDPIFRCAGNGNLPPDESRAYVIDVFFCLFVFFLLQNFEGEATKIWESNIFGKSMYDIAEEGLTAKLTRMQPSTEKKLQNALQRLVNEGRGNLICIIL